jgi:cysteinyl-tRNA synthetase
MIGEMDSIGKNNETTQHSEEVGVLSSSYPISRSMQLSWHLPSLAPNSSAADIYAKAFPLQVFNSLTRSKVPFVPISGNRLVTWYMCGPTVYDSAHMGHARTYICFDILHRIMTKVFHYDVHLTMNITDIDDKIINRANERAMNFLDLSKQYEQEFMVDMKKLNVILPTAITRVSEYIPEIINFISQIISNGFAYASNGSVYFNTREYRKSKSHIYGKLVPENVGNTSVMEEGEGNASSIGRSDKLDVNDFALWKASKENEPFWASPWGNGRPGWHIECSAMCNSIFPQRTIDIHSGGVDLRFPHHDNEIAQSEAYYSSATSQNQWINYFLHSGHLHIDGLKMSKSLKNFIKISDAINRFGARQLRLFFLDHRYNSPLNYSEAAMEEIGNVEKSYVDFYNNVKASLRVLPLESESKWYPRDASFSAFLYTKRDQVYKCFCDDFDTPGVMSNLQLLLKETNRYLEGDKETKRAPLHHLVKASSDFIFSTLSDLGVFFGSSAPSDSAGKEGAGVVGSGGISSAMSLEEKEQLLAPFLEAITSFRASVRTHAKASDTKSILQACDEFRNSSMPQLGVVLEDADGNMSKWKLRDPEEMRKELEEKERLLEEKAKAKAAFAAELARRNAEKEAKAKINPKEMFLHVKREDGKLEYSQFDEFGVPTHDAEGVELPKNVIKKLKKEYAAQEKLVQEWNEKHATSNSTSDQ